jgi:hypothetical protein
VRLPHLGQQIGLGKVSDSSRKRIGMTRLSHLHIRRAHPVRSAIEAIGFFAHFQFNSN